MARREPLTTARRQFGMSGERSPVSCLYFAMSRNDGKLNGLSRKVKNGFGCLSKPRKTTPFACSILKVGLRLGTPGRSALKVTAQKRSLVTIFPSFILQRRESRFRRLFETAKDGVLILDFGTGQITDANPFIRELLGYSTDELVGKQLWQIGLTKDFEANQTAFRKLQ